MSRRRRLLPRLLLWLFVAGLAVTVLPVALLRFVPPPTTAYMLQSPVKPVKYRWVPASRISDNARRAVVASEDQKFWMHHGFDLEAIEKAREHNKRSKRVRGASTISQQTAKNLFLWPGGGYFRKGIEAAYTVLIEALWPKQRILEVYLNVAEFGPGIYGVEAASQAYFHKPAAQLSVAEAAHLASVLPSPRHWSVTRPGSYVQRRANWIVGQMGFGRAARPDEDEPEIPDDLQQQIDDEADGRDRAPAASLPAPTAETPQPVLQPDDEPLPPPQLPEPAPVAPTAVEPPPAQEPAPPDGAPPPSAEPLP